MRSHLYKVAAALLLPVVPLAVAWGKKKPEIPPAFSTAHTVFVEADLNDTARPGFSPTDRDAVSYVQQALREWNRYQLTTDRKQADLIFIVRKGRPANERDSLGNPGNPGTPSPHQSGMSMPGQNPMQSGGGDPMGGTAMAPIEDLLQVFTINPNGKLSGPLWSRQMKDGLDGPSVMLVQVLKSAVEAAYPPAPPAATPPTSPHP
jgi:hypothetical protein